MLLIASSGRHVCFDSFKIKIDENGRHVCFDSFRNKIDEIDEIDEICFDGFKQYSPTTS